MSTNMTLLKRIQNRMLNLTDQPSLITATNDVSQELLTDRHPIEEETKSQIRKKQFVQEEEEVLQSVMSYEQTFNPVKF